MILNTIKKVRCAVITYIIHSLVLPPYRLLFKQRQFPYSTAQLKDMAPETTGNMLVHFLESHNLHLLKDYEAHDIKHIIFGYDADEEGEASLQFFMLGNGWVSLPVLGTVFVSFLTMPEYHKHFKQAYKRGQQTPKLRGTDWFGLMPLPYTTVIEQLNIPAK